MKVLLRTVALSVLMVGAAQGAYADGLPPQTTANGEAPVARLAVARPCLGSQNDIPTTTALPGGASRRPPRKRLGEIQQQYGQDPAARRLLRAARQLEQSMRSSESATDMGIIVGALRGELAAEACCHTERRKSWKSAVLCRA